MEMKEENLKLQTELATLKTLYDSLMNLTPNAVSQSATDSSDDDETNQTLKQYIEENKQFKRENIKYLNQLKEANTKYSECNAKYIELSSLQRAQQNELRSTRSRAAELEEMLQDCISEIRHLEREGADLRDAVWFCYVLVHLVSIQIVIYFDRTFWNEVLSQFMYCEVMRLSVFCVLPFLDMISSVKYMTSRRKRDYMMQRAMRSK